MTSPRPRLRPAQAATLRQHRPRLYDAGGTARVLATARVVCHYSGRSRRVVQRNCVPVACDVASGAALYDLEAAVAALSPLAWRPRGPRRATRDEKTRDT